MQPPDATRSLRVVRYDLIFPSLTTTYNSAKMVRPSKKQQAREEASDQEDEFLNDDEEDDIEEDGPPTVDPYAVLGLETEATADDVKKAYRKLALKHHPGICTASVAIWQC